MFFVIADNDMLARKNDMVELRGGVSKKGKGGGGSYRAYCYSLKVLGINGSQPLVKRDNEGKLWKCRNTRGVFRSNILT